MFGFSADGAAHMQASTQTLMWMGLAGLAAFLLPNTKDISEVFQKGLLKRPSITLYGLGSLGGAAGALAFFASLSLTQSPFLYFNF